VIRPLRRAHRAIVTVLAVALPLAFVQALRGRNPVPAGELSAAVLGSAPRADLPRLVGLRALDGVRLEQRVFATPEGRLSVEVSLAPASAAPDALLYWAAADPGPAAGLPEHALLLGRLAGATRFALPPDAAGGGWLVVYSLIHQEVVIAAELAGRAG
jgi:hypothetical protein